MDSSRYPQDADGHIKLDPLDSALAWLRPEESVLCVDRFRWDATVLAWAIMIIGLVLAALSAVFGLTPVPGVILAALSYTVTVRLHNFGYYRLLITDERLLVCRSFGPQSIEFKDLRVVELRQGRVGAAANFGTLLAVGAETSVTIAGVRNAERLVRCTISAARRAGFVIQSSGVGDGGSTVTEQALPADGVGSEQQGSGAVHR